LRVARLFLQAMRLPKEAQDLLVERVIDGRDQPLVAVPLPGRVAEMANQVGFALERGRGDLQPVS
jgi:hypothetical protein